jgi:hypothetical protein
VFFKHIRVHAVGGVLIHYRVTRSKHLNASVVLTSGRKLYQNLLAYAVCSVELSE